MPKYADQKGGVNMKRRYICQISGEPCPVDPATWNEGDARETAKATCELHRYESSDRQEDDRRVINDFCRNIRP